MNEQGRRCNLRRYHVLRAWLNLYICITTDDEQAFYKALNGDRGRTAEKKWLWEYVNGNTSRLTKNKNKRGGNP